MELKKLSETKAKLTIVATEEDLSPIKSRVTDKLAKDVKIAGFRKGKAPKKLVEKNVDQQALQSEFLDEALTIFYYQAAKNAKIRPVAKPEVTIKKFVPFTTLEFEAEVDAVMDIKLADYKSIKLPKPKAEVSAKDIADVVNRLKIQVAKKKEVDRPAKKSDEVWIDFKGVDEQGKPVAGADGKDYPLVLGSKTFIPGFEENIAGLKKGDEKNFEVTFPKDYGVKALQGKKVKFTVNIKKVNEVIEPELNDSFAPKVGPFTTLKDLKADIKRQLEIERQKEINRQYANTLVEKITDGSKLALPEAMIEHQAQHNLNGLKRNLTYRGQTYEEFLAGEKTTAEKYEKEVVRPEAERQVKASLILAEIADNEDIIVTPKELEVRIQILKGQYKDPQMQAELDKPESHRDIESRLLTEKVLAKLEQYSS